MAVTKQQIKAHLEVIKIVAETIRDLGSVPSGHLYVMVMQHFSLEEYNSIISALKRAGVVEERYHELFWIGNRTAAINPSTGETRSAEYLANAVFDNMRKHPPLDS